MNDPIVFPQKLAGSENIIVPKNTTIWTDAFKFGDVNEFAIAYIQTATGIPNIRIQMEQSFFPPAVEGVTDPNFFVPKTVGDLEAALTSKAMQGGILMPICAPYIRFKITENTNLVTDTLVKIWLSLQKKFTM